MNHLATIRSIYGTNLLTSGYSVVNSLMRDLRIGDTVLVAVRTIDHTKVKGMLHG